MSCELEATSIHSDQTAATLVSVFGTGSAIRPDPLQRADEIGLFLQLLAMDDEDAEGLDCEEVGEDKNTWERTVMDV